MRAALAFVVALLVAVPTVGWSQATGSGVTIELAAARHVLRPHRDRPVLLDPAFARAGTAPGVRTSQLRESGQTTWLAEQLGARLATSPDTGAMYLILSPVDVRAREATVTATVARRAPAGGRGSFYRTVQLYLVRTAAGWRVEREVELGIS